MSDVRYLVFDVEAIADGELIRRVRYPTDELTSDEAAHRFRGELMDQKGNDVLPSTHVVPISIAVAKVSEDYRLQGLTVLDAPEFRPRAMIEKFWQGWEHYGRPTLVTFNGRGYDLPILEYGAFRYGLSVPAWFNVTARAYEQSRNRYNIDRHIDLQDFFSNFGASRVSGGLNLLATLINKPGKSGVDGSQVQPMYDEGRIEEINQYCQCDVLDTYFVFLRSRVLTGQLSATEERSLVEDVQQWLVENSADNPAFASYLDNWMSVQESPDRLSLETDVAEGIRSGTGETPGESPAENASVQHTADGPV